MDRGTYEKHKSRQLIIRLPGTLLQPFERAGDIVCVEGYRTFLAPTGMDLLVKMRLKRLRLCCAVLIGVLASVATNEEPRVLLEILSLVHARRRCARASPKRSVKVTRIAFVVGCG